MKASMHSFLLAAALLLLVPASAMARHAEHDAVQQTMEKVMRAFETGDANLMFEVLRKDGVVLGYSSTQGRMATESTEEWAKGLTGAPAPDEAQRHRRYEILDVTDRSAVVKLSLDYPTWLGVDYLALSKIEGRWMVVSKSWSGQAKPKAP